MAVELQRLIEKVAHMDVTLIAGEDGMHNLVSWVHMVETTEASDFLQGGEIAFVTGLGISNRITLLSLAECIYKKNACLIVFRLAAWDFLYHPLHKQQVRFHHFL